MERKNRNPNMPGGKQASIFSHPPSSSEQREHAAILEKIFLQRPDLSQLLPVTFEHQPTSRKVIRKGNRDHHVGLFASRLNKAMVPFESTLEKQACFIFESHPEILNYRSQPYAVSLFYDGKTRTVFPDFELETAKRKILVDIRYEAKTRKPSFQERCHSLGFFAEQRGMRYTLMTEKMIRDTRLTNTQWLLSLINGQAQPELIEIIWRWILNLQALDFGKLFNLTSNFPQVRHVIACLAVDGHLGLDMNHPLLPQIVRPVFQFGE
ncbi:TnsA endonuclease N-terminal domain-containing protein [Thiolapillus sp.]|uniref:TnsA endonuclease N-terminal domain-containing protein n=1 Tax=Thiolapillus sp. TaxID=2017437 RepID=UPI003AF6FDBE